MERGAGIASEQRKRKGLFKGNKTSTTTRMQEEKKRNYRSKQNLPETGKNRKISNGERNDLGEGGEKEVECQRN